MNSETDIKAEKLTISELKKALSLLIELLEVSELSEFEYKDDLYWKVDDNLAFNLGNTIANSDIFVGSVFDSVQRVKKVISEENMVFVDIDDIATLLKVIYLQLTDIK